MAWLLTWLVQGLAIAFIARVAFRALPGISAATRYAMWWAALVLVLILPIARSLRVDSGANAGVGDAVSAGVSTAVGAAVGAPVGAAVGAGVSADIVAPAAASAAGAVPELLSQTPDSQSFRSHFTQSSSPSLTFLASLPSLPSLPPVRLPRVPDWVMSIAIGLWLGCAMLGLAQVAYSVHIVRRLKESCRRMVEPREADLAMWSAVRGQGRAVSVRTSDRMRTAAVLGLTRPIIAMPRDAAAGLTSHEIDQIVLHEYAHVQRYDDWTKLLQVLIAAFVGWHPAVRLILREIDFEREAACDDYVVDVTGAPRDYARCLTKVIELMPSPELAAVPHMSSSARSATTRIERLLDRRRPAGRFAAMPAMAASVTLAALAFCTVHALPIATDHPGLTPASPLDTTLAPVSADSAGVIDARADVIASRVANAADAANAGNSVVVVDAGRPNAQETRRLDLRIAGAALPIDLPFTRLSPLSRLTDAQLPGSRVTAASSATGASAPASALATLRMTPTSSSMTAASESSPPHPMPSSVATTATGGKPEAREAAADHIATATTPSHSSAAAPRHARDRRPRDVARQPPHRADLPAGSAATPSPTEASFALGPVGSAAETDSMPEASESGHIGRAWESTRDATSKAVGVSARAVGTATKTAGGATKAATNKAAAGVKVSGVKTARALGRVKRTLASVF